MRVDGDQTTGSVIALADDGAVHRVVVSIPGRRGGCRTRPIGTRRDAGVARLMRASADHDFSG